MRSPIRGRVWRPCADYNGHVFVATTTPRSSQKFLPSVSGACSPLTATTNLCATRHARPTAHTYRPGTTLLIWYLDLSFCWRARGHPVAALCKSWPISLLAQHLAWRPNRLPPSREPPVSVLCADLTRPSQRVFPEAYATVPRSCASALLVKACGQSRQPVQSLPA